MYYCLYLLVIIVTSVLSNCCYGYDIPKNVGYEIPRNVKILIQSEVGSSGQWQETLEHKQYVIDQLAPRTDVIEILFGKESHFLPTAAAAADLQEWIDVAHASGMEVALSMFSTPGLSSIPKAIGPVNLTAPNGSTLRPVDATLGEVSWVFGNKSVDYGNVSAVNQAGQNLGTFLSQVQGLDYFMFNETRLPGGSWPEPFNDYLAEAPYFAYGTYSDASLADFRNYIGDGSAKFPVLPEDAVFSSTDPDKFAVIDDTTIAEQTIWNEWWQWRFFTNQRYIETLAGAVQDTMEAQGNTDFKGVIYFGSNRQVYDTAYNLQQINRKSPGVLIDDLQLPYTDEPVLGLASSPNIDILISEDGSSQTGASPMGPSESVQYFKAAAEKYGKSWGNFLQLWTIFNDTHTSTDILDTALDITTDYDSQMVVAYETGVFLPDPNFSRGNYSQEIVDWWDERVEPRVTSPNSADLDQDGDVDGRDFLAWQSGFGIASGADHTEGDTNGDSIVNREDLLIWQNQYGGLGSLSSAVLGNEIPEPTTFVLLLLGLIAFHRVGARSTTASRPISRR